MILYNWRRNRAKKKLTELIEDWENWAACVCHSNENIAINRFKLAKIVMLRQQFLPWGKYFWVESYGFGYRGIDAPVINKELRDMGCGRMGQILSIDLRHGRLCEFKIYDLWIEQESYSEDFPRCKKCSGKRR